MTVGEETQLELIEDTELLGPLLKEMVGFWEAARGNHAMPSPDVVHPSRLPRAALPYLSIVEVLHDPLDFRYRLVGTGVVDMAGVDRTNKLGSEVYDPETLRQALAIIQSMIDMPRPVAFGGRLTWLDRGYRSFQSLQLPLSYGGSTLDRVLATYSFS